MGAFLDGAIAMAFATAGLFFLRFWRDTRDRLFLVFACSFWLLAAARLGLALAGEIDETDRRFYFYLLRLFAYLLILYAILEKNQLLPFGRNKAQSPGGSETSGDSLSPPARN